MATVTVDKNILDTILSELRTIRRVVMTEQKTVWVSASKAKKELNLSDRQLQTIRTNHEGVARQKNRTRYEYDLAALKQVA